jgi:MraZ protein
LIFRGTFEHTLDAKHRLTVPAKFRAALAGGVVLATSPETTKGGPRAVAIWTPEAHDTYTAAALEGKNPLSPSARDLKRMLYGSSFETELDSANRVMIPATLMQYAGLERDVLVIGAGECLEVWDRAAHAEYNEGVLARFPEIAASFDHTD